MKTHPFFTKQIPTYMGNKRKFIPTLDLLLDTLPPLESIADGFSGTGVVARLFKTRAKSKLYVNDLAGYSKTFNQCYLSKNPPSNLASYIEEANRFADNDTPIVPKWIQIHWAPPANSPVEIHHRVYYTPENAKRIDRYRFFIQRAPKKIQPFLLAPLLVECSIHTNTSGQFAAFYKKNKIGHYGGKTETDVKRITQPIKLSVPPNPPITKQPPPTIHISQQDVNDWIKNIPPVDLLYLDPPYNKHPYSIYYFMLDIINNWDTTQEIPDTLRGQPKNWKKSPYNSFRNATESFKDLIKSAKAKYILISYNNGGIISLKEIQEILEKKGKVTRIPITHNTYNRMIGISNYKRKKEEQRKVKEFLWLVTT